MEIFASYTGPDFLAFYVVMLLTCVGLGFWIPANLRPEGRRGPRPVEDLEEVAFLSGGYGQHATAILADLFARGGLTDSSGSKLTVAERNLQAPEAGRDVLHMDGDFRFGEARSLLKGQAQNVEDRLIRAGLLMDHRDRTIMRLLAASPFIVLFVIGFYRYQAGSALGEPTGFLGMLLFLTVILATIRFIKFNPRTVAGEVALQKLEQKSARLRNAPRAEEAGYAVAIFGTAVLVGTPWEPVHAARQAASGGDGGSSGGDGDGGGGCGGGCGGCGG